MAVLVIDLDDRASQGLAQLRTELGEVGTATNDYRQQLIDVNVAQTQTIKTVDIQKASLGSVTKQWIESGAQVKLAAVNTAEEVSKSFIKSSEAVAQSLIRNTLGQTVALAEIAASFGKFTVGSIAAATTASAIWGKPKTVIQQNITATNENTAAVGSHTSTLARYGAVVLTTIGGAAGLTAALALQRKEFTSLEQVAATTGSTIFKTVTGVGPQIIGATVAFKAYEAILARTGERWDEFGQKTTNLDRARLAVNSLAGEIRDNLATGFRDVPAYYARLTGIKDAWEEIDRAVTRSNDNFIQNVGHVRSLAEWMGIVAANTKDFDDRVRRTTDDFERLREISEKWGNADDAKRRSKSADEYARKIGELGVHINANLEVEKDASHSALTAAVARIDAEIAKRKEAAGQLAAANKLTAEEAKKYEEEVSALRDLRAEHTAKLDQYEKDARTANLRSFAESEREKERLYRQMSEERIERNEAEYERVKKLKKEEAEFEAKLEADNERSRQIVAEMAANDRRMKREKDLQEQRKAAETELAVEREKFARMKALRQQALEKAGINGQDLLQRADPRQVLQTLQNQARQQAKQKAAAENQDLLREGMFDSNSPARKAYERKLRQAQDEAAKQATRDFAKGQTDPTQLANAQANVAGQQLRTMQQQGRISQSTLQATTELLQATAQAQAQLQEQQRQIDQLTRDSQAINQQARRQGERNRAIAGSN